jgi:anaerobic selenocysteine-containing dehydrogenase
LILTTYKVATQSHSRTQNSKWLTELYHTNPAWIHPETAAARGIRDGAKIKLTSAVGSMTTRARVTEGIHPGVIAISNHCGHWAYGQYASLEKSAVHESEDDSARIWWKSNGAHPNWVIPNAGDPIGGQHRWMDTVVKVEKA